MYELIISQPLTAPWKALVEFNAALVLYYIPGIYLQTCNEAIIPTTI